jgi:hypothetical protein
MGSSDISVSEFEAKVLEIEEIVIRVRASSSAKVLDYTYERKAAGNQTVADWLDGRIRPLINRLEVSVIGGDCTSPHGRTKLETLRSSYEK